MDTAGAGKKCITFLFGLLSGKGFYSFVPVLYLFLDEHKGY